MFQGISLKYMCKQVDQATHQGQNDNQYIPVDFASVAVTMVKTEAL
jgi:hypothetical protein